MDKIREYRTLFSDQRVTPVFWIDEAQYLNQHILADLKLLMNFEMDSRNYAIMILSGLPSINSTLSMRIHEALHQRIVMNYCFQGLSEEETKNYLETRLRLCGTKTDIFTPSAMIAMSNYSNGSIRKLDNVIHKALMIGCSKEGKVIDNELILEAITELVKVKNKKVREVGTHNELIDLDGEYKKLWNVRIKEKIK